METGSETSCEVKRATTPSPRLAKRRVCVPRVPINECVIARTASSGKPANKSTSLASLLNPSEFGDVIVIVMGVSGCGKTTVGRLLAARMGWEFLDADGFHPPANVEKMRAGTPLGDADRVAWLAALRKAISDRLAAERSAVLACSALREGYRRELRRPGEPIHYVYLKGDFATIHRRLAAGREGHYMPLSLLGSQFETLEEPADAIVVSVELSPEQAVEQIVRALDRAAPVPTNAGQATSSRPDGP
jgi:gluconokinase